MAHFKKQKWISNKFIKCDRCNTLSPAYYLLSIKTKGLWIQCPHCKNHSAPFIDGLDLPEKPTNHFKKLEKKGLLFEQNQIESSSVKDYKSTEGGTAFT